MVRQHRGSLTHAKQVFTFVDVQQREMVDKCDGDWDGSHIKLS